MYICKFDSDAFEFDSDAAHLHSIQMIHIHIDSAHMCILFKYRAFEFDSDAVHLYLH